MTQKERIFDGTHRFWCKTQRKGALFPIVSSRPFSNVFLTSQGSISGAVMYCIVAIVSQTSNKHNTRDDVNALKAGHQRIFFVNGQAGVERPTQ